MIIVAFPVVVWKASFGGAEGTCLGGEALAARWRYYDVIKAFVERPMGGNSKWLSDALRDPRRRCVQRQPARLAVVASRVTSSLVQSGADTSAFAPELALNAAPLWRSR